MEQHRCSRAGASLLWKSGLIKWNQSSPLVLCDPKACVRNVRASVQWRRAVRQTLGDEEHHGASDEERTRDVFLGRIYEGQADGLRPRVRWVDESA